MWNSSEQAFYVKQLSRKKTYDFIYGRDQQQATASAYSQIAPTCRTFAQSRTVPTSLQVFGIG
jgi:hypothetical protein